MAAAQCAERRVGLWSELLARPASLDHGHLAASLFRLLAEHATARRCGAVVQGGSRRPLLLALTNYMRYDFLLYSMSTLNKKNALWIVVGIFLASLTVSIFVSKESMLSQFLLNLATEAVGIFITISVIERIVDNDRVKFKSGDISASIMNRISYIAWFWTGGSRNSSDSELIQRLRSIKADTPLIRPLRRFIAANAEGMVDMITIAIGRQISTAGKLKLLVNTVGTLRNIVDENDMSPHQIAKQLLSIYLHCMEICDIEMSSNMYDSPSVVLETAPKQQRKRMRSERIKTRTRVKTTTVVSPVRATNLAPFGGWPSISPFASRKNLPNTMPAINSKRPDGTCLEQLTVANQAPGEPPIVIDTAQTEKSAYATDNPADAQSKTTKDE